ncbi:MAG: hypothetical protein WD492_11300 [Alkalispirochaeta sp.]
MKLTTAQIGRAGELLVQEQLLLYGIESAPLTTDTGIDLMANSARRNDAVMIQVKANLRPKSGGGKGTPALDWWVPDDSPAEMFAFVDLSTNRVWLVTREEIAKLAQQYASGRYHFFIATDPSAAERRDGKAVHDYTFQGYLLENRVRRVM